METLVILKSSHRGGILHLTFSSDGSLLLSIGMDKTFSMQVYQWQQSRTLAFKNTGYNPVFGVRFNPYDKSQIVTCGYEHIALWKLKGTHITCKTALKYRSPQQVVSQDSTKEGVSSSGSKIPVIMCIDFISFQLGSSIQSDILFGTSLGEITTYCSGKHFILHESAHDGAINCIRVTNQITPKDVVNIFTGGEDGFIKVWDAACRIIQTIDMRKSQVLADLINKKAFGV